MPRCRCVACWNQQSACTPVAPILHGTQGRRGITQNMFTSSSCVACPWHASHSCRPSGVLRQCGQDQCGCLGRQQSRRRRRPQRACRRRGGAVPSVAGGGTVAPRMRGNERSRAGATGRPQGRMSLQMNLRGSGWHEAAARRMLRRSAQPCDAGCRFRLALAHAFRPSKFAWLSSPSGRCTRHAHPKLTRHPPTPLHPAPPHRRCTPQGLGKAFTRSQAL